MATPSKPVGLTAAEFFGKKLDGYSKTDAHRGTSLSYSAIHDATDAEKTPRADTLRALQMWSLGAAEKHGVYISAAATVGFTEPTATDLRKAAGE